MLRYAILAALAISCDGTCGASSERGRSPFVVTDSFGDFRPLRATDWRATYNEPRQTFKQFRDALPRPPSSTQSVLYLLPLGELDPDLGPSVDVLAEFSHTFFSMPTAVLPAVPTAAVNPRQRVRPAGHVQLFTPDIFAYLRANMPNDAYALLAVTQRDLYPTPRMNFVFGIASPESGVGVVSMARFHPAFYGEESYLDGEPEVVRTEVLLRTLKLTVHELGHMFGVMHCDHMPCVMNGTNSVDETDRLPLHVCPFDLHKLAISVGFDPLARYRALRAFYDKYGLDERSQWIAGRIAELTEP